MRAVVLILCLTVASGAHAQGLPSEPVSVADGRLVLGGELTATVGPEDPGFFNYTDYEYSALRNLRFALTAELRAHPRLQFLTEVRVDRGEAFEPYGMYARIRPWISRRFDVQVGRVPPTFGAFGRGGYTSGNMLIGYPLAYQYLTSLRTDALPSTISDLLRMRGRGWLVNYPLGNTAAAPGLPIVNASRWDTGIQVHGVEGIVEWTASITTGSLSNPRVDDDNGGRQFAGRSVVRPTAAVAIGLSAARAPFMSRTLAEALPADTNIERAIQQAVGLDGEYSVGRLITRGEMIWSEWSLPSTFTGGPLHARAVMGEARYRLLPGIHLAVRAERLDFNEVDSADRREQWDGPVSRFEFGGGWALQRNVMIKASWQRNRRDAGRVRRDTLGAAQLVYWF